MRKEKSTAETYMALQECMNDLLTQKDRSMSMVFVRLNELCNGSERLFTWAATEMNFTPARKDLMHALYHHVQDCKDGDARVSQSFRDFLQGDLLRELKRLRPFILSNDTLAS